MSRDCENTHDFQSSKAVAKQLLSIWTARVNLSFVIKSWSNNLS